MDSLGLYISVPFCRSKCTYCNFASGVHSAELQPLYVVRLVEEIRGARLRAAEWNAEIPRRVESIFFGGGTPSLLPPELWREIWLALTGEFDLAQGAEVTLECAPGQLSGEMLDTITGCGVNRLSFGVQSFVDREAAVSGRLHTRQIAIRDLDRARQAGIERLSVDLIAGLPGQTMASWRESLEVLIESGVRHASIYMLEVDEESRLGRELLAGGGRYQARSVPSEDLTVEMYEAAAARLGEEGIEQYEISNFACTGEESRHNLRYWRRDPYLGFGLDAHSMLRTRAGSAVRFETTAVLEDYLSSSSGTMTSLSKADAETADGYLAAALPSPSFAAGSSASFPIVRPGPAGSASTQFLGHRVLSPREEIEEAWFLGLRLRAGVEWGALEREFAPLRSAAVHEGNAVSAGKVERRVTARPAGTPAADAAKSIRAIFTPIVDELCTLDLLSNDGEIVRLTSRGILFSNEVFARFMDVQNVG